jgi:hypothetical protein
MKQAIIGLAAIGLASCATPGAEPAPDVMADAPEAMLCNAEPVQTYAGKGADQAIGTAILKASGARTLRWGPPNAAWTMDFREDRVNVRYDAAMTIIEITCG